jgi:hypothetical protein
LRTTDRGRDARFDRAPGGSVPASHGTAAAAHPRITNPIAPAMANRFNRNAALGWIDIHSMGGVRYSGIREVEQNPPSRFYTRHLCPAPVLGQVDA